jgi:hypothetical protein
MKKGYSKVLLIALCLAVICHTTGVRSLQQWFYQPRSNYTGHHSHYNHTINLHSCLTDVYGSFIRQSPESRYDFTSHRGGGGKG